MGCQDLTVGEVPARDFAAGLVASVSAEEWRLLEQGGFEGEINAFNRAVLLRLHDSDAADIADELLSVSEACRMADMLDEFLESHLPGNPRARRWVRLSCLALAFVFHEPLHPAEVVKAEVRVADGEAIWYCPAREGVETLCGFCASRPMSELLDAESRAVEQTLQRR